MVDINSRSSAARQAGEDYQIIFRTLDLAIEQEEGGISDRIGTIPEVEIAEILSGLGSGRSVPEARALVRAFTEAHPAASVHGDILSCVIALKRRGLIDYMAAIHPIARENRNRRESGTGSESQANVLSSAMTVTPQPSGRHHGPVVRAAVRYKGFAWSMPAPARHSDIINDMFAMLGGVIDSLQTDGFLTASGHFVDRVEGLAAARAAGQQFVEQPLSAELFSENVW